MQTLKKQIQIFFTNNDEEQFSVKLKELFPLLVFVDGNLWQSPSPLIKNSIQECDAKIIFLWNRQIINSLPSIKRKDGKFTGPSSGIVIQVIRSCIDNQYIVSGRVAVGVSSSSPIFVEMSAFIKGVWKVLKKTGSPDLFFYNQNNHTLLDTKIVGYLVGNDAVSWCKQATGRFLKDRSAGHLYLPKDQR